MTVNVVIKNGRNYLYVNVSTVFMCLDNTLCINHTTQDDGSFLTTKYDISKLDAFGVVN